MRNGVRFAIFAALMSGSLLILSAFLNMENSASELGESRRANYRSYIQGVTDSFTREDMAQMSDDDKAQYLRGLHYRRIARKHGQSKFNGSVNERALLAPELQDSNLVYVSSALWSGPEDVRVVGEYAYCLFENGLVIVNVSDSTSPSFVSKLYLPGVYSYYGLDVDSTGNYAYVVNHLPDSDGFYIIDVTDTLNPHVASEYQDNGYPTDISVQDSFAYLLCWDKLRVIDISDKENPQPRDSISLDSYGRDLFVQDSLAYVVRSSYYIGDSLSLHVINVSKKDSVSMIGSLDIDSNYCCPDLFVIEDFAYVAAGARLDIIDVSNPESLHVEARYDTLEAEAVFAADNEAYLTSRQSFWIADISDPANPIFRGGCFTPGWGEEVWGIGDMAYVADVPAGLTIVDASDKQNPYIAGQYATPSFTLGVQVVGDYAFTANGGDGLQIVNISDKANPEKGEEWDTPGWAQAVFVSDTLAYIADGPAGLQIINVANPAVPESIGGYGTPSYASDVFVAGNYAYTIGDFDSSLQIIDVIDPSTPSAVGSYDSLRWPWAVFVKDSIAYVADVLFGLQIINIANPSQPFRCGIYDSSGFITDVFVRDTLAYVVGDSFYILSISDPCHPRLVGAAYQVGWSVYVCGRYAYVGASGGMILLDVSDPSDIQVLGYHFDPYMAWDIFASDGYVYVADMYSLMILLHTGARSLLEISSVEAPEGVVSLGESFFPEAIVRNIGSDEVGYYAKFSIGPVYCESTAVTTVGAWETDTVTFPVWNTTEAATYQTICSIHPTDTTICEGSQKHGIVYVRSATAPEVHSISPAGGVSDQLATVTITGARFQSGLTAKLMLPGQVDILADSVDFQSSSLINVTFNLMDADTGWWDLRVINPDTEAYCVYQGFNIVPFQGQILTFGSWDSFSVYPDSSIYLGVDVPDVDDLFILAKKTTVIGFDSTWAAELTLYCIGQQMAYRSGGSDYDIHLQNPEPGWYIIEILSSDSGEGLIKVCSSLDTLNLGEWKIGEVLRPRGYDWVQLDVPASAEPLFFQTEGSGLWNTLDVYHGYLGNSSKHWQFSNSGTGYRIEGEIENPPSGRYYLRYMDSAVMRSSGDQMREYLVCSDTVSIKDPPIVQVSSIEAPQGGVPLGGNVNPEAVVRNISWSEASFYTSFVIGEVYSESTGIVNLQALENDTVFFPAWNPAEAAAYLTICTTHPVDTSILDGDEKVGMVWVEPASGPEIHRISPGVGVIGQMANVEIFGDGFENGITARLVLPGEIEILADTVNFGSDSLIEAVFSLTGADTGRWDLNVINPDSQTYCFYQGFRVLAFEGDSIVFCDWTEFSVQQGSSTILSVNVPDVDNLFVLLKKTTHIGYSSTWDGSIELLRGQEQLAFESGNNDFDIHIQNPEPGWHTLEILSTSSGQGLVEVCSSLVGLNLGEWTIGEVLRPYGCDWVQLDIPAGADSLFFQTEGFGLWSTLDVYHDSLTHLAQHWQFSNMGAGYHIEGAIGNPPSGRYYLRYMDSAVMQGTDDQTREYMILADIADTSIPPCDEPVITDLSTYTGATTSPVNVIIYGKCLDSAATVALIRGGLSDIIATNVFGDSLGTTLKATFDLTGAEPGDWTFTVTNPNNSVATAPNPFIVVRGGEPELWVEIVGRSQIREGRMQTYYIRYGNAGNVDPYLAYLFIKIPGEVNCELNIPGFGLVENLHQQIPPEGGVTETPIVVEMTKLPPGSNRTMELTITATAGILSVPISVAISQDPCSHVQLFSMGVIGGGIGSPKLYVLLPDRAEYNSLPREGGVSSIALSRSPRPCDSKYPVIVDSYEDVPVNSTYLVRWQVGTWEHEGYVQNASGNIRFYWAFNQPQNGTQEVSYIWMSEFEANAGVRRMWIQRTLPPEASTIEEADAIMAKLNNTVPTAAGAFGGVPFSGGPAVPGQIWCSAFTQRANEHLGQAVYQMGDITTPFGKYCESNLHTDIVLSRWNCVDEARPYAGIPENPGAEWSQTIEPSVVGSSTPEDKYGPGGYDQPETAPGLLTRFVKKEREFNYRVDFWNKEDATAPAQIVFVDDTLDSDLDLATFGFTEVGFLKWTVPLEGGQYFNVDVDMRPSDSLIVNVEGTFDPDNRAVSWIFRSLDPATMEYPEDPMAGFLPPMSDSGYEIGWVDFSIDPQSDLPTGTEITNQAFVNFDSVGGYNPAPKEGPYLNTIDAYPPTSQINDLPDRVQGRHFEVCWSGEDDALGSGIRNYTIYFSVNGSQDSVWLANTTDTCDTFHAPIQPTPTTMYTFYSVARDNVGNVEVADTANRTPIFVGIGEEEEENLPFDFSLSQNYPNPFNPTSVIQYAIPRDCRVTIILYNILGQKVRTLVDEEQTAGYKKVTWDSKNDQGEEIASGIYFYRIMAGDFTQVKKMVLLK